MLKLKPFEEYVGDDLVLNYIGLRADEVREGYISHKANIKAVYPFKEDGLVRSDIIRILEEESGLGLPPYLDWGRTRSGCFFCFYQQKIEWVRLKEMHPDLFEEAKKYEYSNQKNGQPFYWSGTESLAELEKPQRIEEIKQDWSEAQERKRRQRKNKTLLHVLGGREDCEEEYDSDACLICQI